jgi:hypothetical protein
MLGVAPCVGSLHCEAPRPAQIATLRTVIEVETGRRLANPYSLPDHTLLGQGRREPCEGWDAWKGTMEIGSQCWSDHLKLVEVRHACLNAQAPHLGVTSAPIGLFDKALEKEVSIYRVGLDGACGKHSDEIT